MSIDGLELDLRWGPAQPKEGFKDNLTGYGDWLQKFKVASQRVDKHLLAGSWNPVDVIYAPATADEIGQLEITAIKTGKASISLRK